MRKLGDDVCGVGNEVVRSWCGREGVGMAREEGEREREK